MLRCSPPLHPQARAPTMCLIVPHHLQEQTSVAYFRLPASVVQPTRCKALSLHTAVPTTTFSWEMSCKAFHICLAILPEFSHICGHHRCLDTSTENCCVLYLCIVSVSSCIDEPRTPLGLTPLWFCLMVACSQVRTPRLAFGLRTYNGALFYKNSKHLSVCLHRSHVIVWLLFGTQTMVSTVQ